MCLLAEMILYFLLTIVLFEIFTRVRPHTQEWKDAVEVTIRGYLNKPEPTVAPSDAMTGSTASTLDDATDNGSESIPNGIIKEGKEKKVLKMILFFLLYQYATGGYINCVFIFAVLVIHFW